MKLCVAVVQMMENLPNFKCGFKKIFRIVKLREALKN